MSNLKLLLAIITLCSACGSSFDAGGSGGAGGGNADAGAPGTTGGDTGAAGAPSDAGAPSAGASTGGAATGGSNTGGSSTGGSNTGGSSAGAGGHAAGGSAGVGGNAGADCTALKAAYAAALEKARVCDKGSTTQCETGSTLPSIGCGCPVLVNSMSEATTLAKQKYQAYQDAKCNAGPICNIACLAYTSAMCSQQAMGSGNVFVCTGAQGVPVN